MPERIVIERLEFYGRCGVTEEERRKAQLIAVDLELEAAVETAALTAGEDVPTATAALVFGLEPDEVTPEDRDRGKTTNFALVYGQSSGSTAERLNITRDEADALVQRYFSNPRVEKAWRTGVKAETRRTGFVTTPFGRRRNVPQVHSQNEKERLHGDRLAVNTVIQGGCADVTKMAIIRCYRTAQNHWPGKVHLVLTVHDSLTFEVDEDIPLEEVYPVLYRVLTLPVRAHWPKLDVDCSVGYRYGSLVPYVHGEPFEFPDRATVSAPKPSTVHVDEDDEEDTIVVHAPERVTSELVVSFPGGATRTQATALIDLVQEHPGDLKVSLRNGADLHPLGTTSLASDSLLWVQRLGPVVVQSVSPDEAVDPLAGLDL